LPKTKKKEPEDSMPVPVRIPIGLLNEIDGLVKRSKFKNRSEFLIFAVRQCFENLRRDEMYDIKTIGEAKE
jgi:Arc/MetJ-type ribon-helix-helix transcriptional regulator